MTPLEREQRGVLALLKGRPWAEDDPYLAQLSRSPRLALLREIAVRWRMYQLEAQCRYTTRTLKQLGRFESVVAEYFANYVTSPRIEEFSAAFLASLAGGSDPLLREVAATELALIAVRSGSPQTFHIVWDRNPDTTFGALLAQTPLPPATPGQGFLLRVDTALPGLLECTRT